MNRETKKINEIKVSDQSTWKQHAFLTFDTDWAKDFIIEDTVNILLKYNLNATFFATGMSNLLDELLYSSNFEIGIHPNFNSLLFDKRRSDTAEDIIFAMKNQFPDSTSVRSHSLTHNELLLDLFAKNNLSNVCNQYLPDNEVGNFQPFMLWDDLQLIPHCFQDNVFLKTNSREPLDLYCSEGLLVYNFHPIHIYLNTPRIDHYEKAKAFYHDKNELDQYRFSGTGIRTKFMQLCKRLSQVD